MKFQIQVLALAAVVVLLCGSAGAEVVTIDISSNTAATLRSLGKSFISGCVVLAGGAVLFAWALRDKGK